MARLIVSTLLAASWVLSGCAAPRPTAENEPRPAVQPPATFAPEPAPPHAATPARATAPSAAPAQTAPVPPASAKTPTHAPTAAAKPAPAAKPATAEAPKVPTLDLSSLEQRLKDTKAIGVFTKISLKNQVDDLLAELRAFHQGADKTPAAALRQKYDTLIIKVLTLLQDGDPQLAAAIAASRKALWGILMDPQKFSQI